MDIGKWYSYTGTPTSSTSTQSAGIDVMVVSQNQINNTSLVRIRPWAIKTSGSGGWNTSQQTLTIKANNSSKTSKTTYDFREATTGTKNYLKNSNPFKRVSGSGTLVSGAYVYDFTITHNDDGSKNNVPVYALIPLYNDASGRNWTVDIDIDLPKIARANTLTYSYTTIDEPIKFSIGKASSNFTSTLTFHSRNEDGTYSYTYTIAEKTSETSIEYTIPTNILNTILANNKTKNKVQFTFYIYTYSGNDELGINGYLANIPLAQTNPVVNATYIDTNQTTIALTGSSSKIIKYVSQPKVTITATPQQMADIVSYSTIWGNSSSTTKETTFVNGIDSNILQVSAKDSRNWVGNISYDITGNYIDYIKLGFEKFTLERPETTSNTINANINGVWFNGNFGVSTNTIELKFRYKEKDGSYGEYQTITLTIENNKFSYSGSIGDAYNYQKQYDFEFVLTDKVMSLVATFNVTSGESIIRVGETYVRILGDVKIRGNVSIDGNLGDITVNSINGKNLFNKNTIINGWLRYSDNVLMDTTSTTFMTSDYIVIEENETYTLNLYNSTQLASGGIMFYNENREWIQPGIPETKTVITFTTPENAKYVKFVLRNDAKDYVQLEKGSKATEHSEYRLFDCTFLTEPAEKIFEGIIETNGTYNFTKSLANYREICVAFRTDVKMLTVEMFKEICSYFPGTLKLMGYESETNSALIGCSLDYISDTQFECKFCGFIYFSNSKWTSASYNLIVYGIK